MDDELEEITIVTDRAITAGKPAEFATGDYKTYVLLPFLFLTVALMGGLRIGVENSEFLFVRPALICLVFGVVLMVLFFRARLLKLESWFSEDFTAVENIANAAVLISLYAAAVRSLIRCCPKPGFRFGSSDFVFCGRSGTIFLHILTRNGFCKALEVCFCSRLSSSI